MQADELDHIRADVQQAILEAQQHDPTVALEILWRLFDDIGYLAGDNSEFLAPWRGNFQGMYYRSAVQDWAGHLLRAVQGRAVSKVPYGEVPTDEPPEDHRD